ncbi:hypothetical protein [Paracoccus homiensis]|nr:hypothetical protein [Paracoccus homiensis]
MVSNTGSEGPLSAGKTEGRCCVGQQAGKTKGQEALAKVVFILDHL